MEFKKVLVVEDEKNLAQAILIALKKLGIESPGHATTLKEAAKMVREQSYELIILDRNLPDGDGLSLCQELRSKRFPGLILMLTAKGLTQDRVQGLNAGADDYLPKPFSWDELTARIHALARRAPVRVAEVLAGAAASPESPAKPTPWQRDEAKLQIRGPRGWVALTPLEFKLASHLILAKGDIVSRDELLKDVWGFKLLPKTRTVDHFLGRLRKRFEDDPDNPKHFLTVRGAGYRFEQ